MFSWLAWLPKISLGISRFAEAWLTHKAALARLSSDERQAKLAAELDQTVLELKNSRHRTEAQKELALGEQQFGLTRFVRPALAVPVVVYCCAAVLSAVSPQQFGPDGTWLQLQVAERMLLPGDLHVWFGAIVFAYFLIRPVEKYAGRRKPPVKLGK